MLTVKRCLQMHDGLYFETFLLCVEVEIKFIFMLCVSWTEGNKFISEIEIRSIFGSLDSSIWFLPKKVVRSKLHYKWVHLLYVWLFRRRSKFKFNRKRQQTVNTFEEIRYTFSTLQIDKLFEAQNATILYRFFVSITAIHIFFQSDTHTNIFNGAIENKRFDKFIFILCISFDLFSFQIRWSLWNCFGKAMKDDMRYAVTGIQKHQC